MRLIGYSILLAYMDNVYVTKHTAAQFLQQQQKVY